MAKEKSKTVNIAGAKHQETRMYAAKHGLKISAVIEEGIDLVLKKDKKIKKDH